MKSLITAKWLAILFAAIVISQTAFAQTKADIFDANKPLTFLGIDYSLTKFIGTPLDKESSFSPWTVVKTKDNGVVSPEQFQNDFTVQWNQLFIDEEKKYDVAKATHRSSVKLAIDVAIKANKSLKGKEYFSNNPGDFHLLTEADITNAVKNYNFQKETGLGLIFFVEGMSKGVASEGIWVTFVDINSKTVLLTKYMTGKPGGSGFRNYWAKPIYLILKDMEDDFKKWN